MGARRVYLHIGQGKTGTSTIQQFLVRNRRELASHGYLYPEISGPARHLELSLYARPDFRDDGHLELVAGPVGLSGRLADRDREGSA